MYKIVFFLIIHQNLYNDNGDTVLPLTQNPFAITSILAKECM